MIFFLLGEEKAEGHFITVSQYLKRGGWMLSIHKKSHGEDEGLQEEVAAGEVSS